MPIDRQIVGRLAFIRFLYSEGVQQSRRPQPLASTAVLAFHDAVEMFLLLAAEYLRVNLSRNVNFDGYFGEIERDSQIQLPLRPAMRRMNNSRVNFKHHGSIPSAMDLEQFRADVTTFLTDATQLIFDVDFNSVDMIDLVIQQGAVERLRDAERLASLGEYYKALGLISKAFDELLEDYANRKRTRTGGSPYSWWPPDGVRATPPPLKRSEHDPAILQRTQAIMSAIAGIERSMRVLAVGLDYRRYARFQLIVPPIVNVASGDGLARAVPGFQVDQSDYDFCRQFVIETALQLAEMDFDLNLKQLIKDHRLRTDRENE